MDIQWYPGHMTKSVRMMQEQIALVDIVIELLDARAPRSSKNPDIDQMARNKKRIIVLNKSDLANADANDRWRSFYLEQGFRVIVADSLSGKGLGEITALSLNLMAEKIEREKKRGRIFVPVRAMIVGVPNVGKSTLINRYVGKSPAKTANRPGVTRGRQWIRIKRGFELMDTPGILWPKLDEPEVGINLAITGAITDNVTDVVELSLNLIKKLTKLGPDSLVKRYGLEPSGEPFEFLEEVAKARSYEKKAGEYDLDRAASAIIGDFRAGRLGRISLETAEGTNDGKKTE